MYSVELIRLLLLLAVASLSLPAHAPPTTIPATPIRARAGLLLDATGVPFVLKGANLPNWETAPPLTYRVMRHRWNMNQVRFPLSVATWRREGQDYLDRAAKAVATANSENLVVLLAAVGDEPDRFPGANTLAFWRAAAAAFRNNPRTLFSLYTEPARSEARGWTEWHTAMQTLIDAIRAAGAEQVIAVPAFHDSTGFLGLPGELYPAGPDLMLEAHPYFDLAPTDAGRIAMLGSVLNRFPLLAGGWGIPIGKNVPACTDVPKDAKRVTDMLTEAVTYFDNRFMSWAVSDFAAGSLIQAGPDFAPTTLDAPWTCDASTNPATGLGQFLLFALTGDPGGFGSIQASQIASAAGGFPGPIAPGEILSIYGQGVGAAVPSVGALDANGKLPVTVGEVQVLFDGVPAPIYVAGYFQVNVQIPWEIAGKTSTTVQLFYRSVPSNPLSLPVAAAAPELFTIGGTFQTAALNQDGSLNTSGAPAARGSVVVFFGTGLGITNPPGVTGQPASGAGATALPVTVRIGNVPAEVLYAGPAPGLVGVQQINVRVPESITIAGPAGPVGVNIAAGEFASRAGVTVWVK